MAGGLWLVDRSVPFVWRVVHSGTQLPGVNQHASVSGHFDGFLAMAAQIALHRKIATTMGFNTSHGLRLSGRYLPHKAAATDMVDDFDAKNGLQKPIEHDDALFAADSCLHDSSFVHGQ